MLSVVGHRRRNVDALSVNRRRSLAGINKISIVTPLHKTKAFPEHSIVRQHHRSNQVILSKMIFKGRVSALPSLSVFILALSHICTSQLVVPQAQAPYDLEEEHLEQIAVDVDFGWHNPTMEGTQPNGPPLLSDILGIDRSWSIFAGLGRSVESVVCPKNSLHC
jgi:hypothetical protein